VWVGVLQDIRNRLNIDPSFSDRFSPLQVEDVSELMDICLETAYFQLENFAIGISLLPMVSDILWKELRKDHWILQNTNPLIPQIIIIIIICGVGLSP
jgi:hypothetical protein